MSQYSDQVPSSDPQAKGQFQPAVNPLPTGVGAFPDDPASYDILSVSLRLPQQVSSGSSSLPPNIAGLLAYLFGWLGGLFFLFIEKNNWEVRFNAMQSVIVSVSYTLFLGFLSGVLFLLQLGFLTMVVSWAYFGYVVYMMVMAYRGRHIKLPVVGGLAERLAITFMR